MKTVRRTHLYHLVEPSPWPIVAAFAAFFLLSGLKNRELCKSLGISSLANDPFIPLTVDKSKELVDLKALPVSCFLSSDKTRFKNLDEDLFSFVRENQTERVVYKVRLVFSLERYSIKQFFDNFNKKPSCFIDEMDELVKEGTIELDKFGYGQWPKKPTLYEQSSYFSSVKKPFSPSEPYTSSVEI